MASNIIVPLASGFEEVEAVTIVDLLRRAGIQVTVVGVDGMSVRGSHNITLSADALLDEIESPMEGVVLPGGMPGTKNLMMSAQVCSLVGQAHAQGKLCAAICAAPRVLDTVGVLDGHRYTCYPGTEAQISRGTFVEQPVVRDGNVITSRGVGTAIAFSLELVEYLLGARQRDALADAIVFGR